MTRWVIFSSKMGVMTSTLRWRFSGQPVGASYVDLWFRVFKVIYPGMFQKTANDALDLYILGVTLSPWFETADPPNNSINFNTPLRKPCKEQSTIAGSCKPFTLKTMRDFLPSFAAFISFSIILKNRFNMNRGDMMNFLNRVL